MRAEAIIAITMLLLSAAAAASAWRNTAKQALRHPAGGQSLMPVRVIDPEFADCLFDRCLGVWRFQLGLAAMEAREEQRKTAAQVSSGNPIRVTRG